MNTKKDGRTHPGNTEFVTIRQVEIEVQGSKIMVDVEIPIACRIVCDSCSTPVQWSKGEDADGTVVMGISEVGCGCLRRCQDE